MQNYLNLLKDILETGEERPDRTGTGVLSKFGCQMTFDLSSGFPLVTTKEVRIKNILTELFWFIKGDTNVHYLNDYGCRIWNEWADENGNLGPIYGAQWRRWLSGSTQVDQLALLITGIKKNPYSRRHILNSWNVGQLDQMALVPCHVLAQFYVSNDNELSCQLYQRSADMFLGVPYNIASYSFLTHMIAQVCGLKVGKFIHTIGDAHIYLNHTEQVKLQLSKKPWPPPQLWMDKTVTRIEGFRHTHFEMINYRHHPFIKAKVAV